MEKEGLHPWSVGLTEADAIQIRFAPQVKLRDEFQKITIIAGIGLIFRSNDNFLVTAGTLYTYPNLKLIQTQTITEPVTFPYRSEYMAFCAGPAILKLLGQLPHPDLIIFPGRGAAHPRGLGLASHLGIWLDLPTIACSKRPIVSDYIVPSISKGKFTPLPGGFAELGAVVRTQKNVKPIFVSIGHKISLKSAIEVVLKCCTKYRMPEPLRMAGIFARRGKRVP